MSPDDGLPPEMPEDCGSSIAPLDDDTAERLLTGRLHPCDAPPAYAGVARVLQAATAPPTPEELAGEAAAVAAFRSAGERRVGGVHRVAGARPGPGGRGVAGRARLVAVALAGALALGGLWMAAGAQTAPGLPSRFGGPGSGGAGSGAAGYGSGAGGAGGSWRAGPGSTGELRPTMPGTGAVDGERPMACLRTATRRASARAAPPAAVGPRPRGPTGATPATGTSRPSPSRPSPSRRSPSRSSRSRRAASPRRPRSPHDQAVEAKAPAQRPDSLTIGSGGAHGGGWCGSALIDGGPPWRWRCCWGPVAAACSGW
jgi:hypothetical protein